jgi:hypothetical protein
MAQFRNYYLLALSLLMSGELVCMGNKARLQPYHNKANKATQTLIVTTAVHQAETHKAPFNQNQRTGATTTAPVATHSAPQTLEATVSLIAAQAQPVQQAPAEPTPFNASVKLDAVKKSKEEIQRESAQNRADFLNDMNSYIDHMFAQDPEIVNPNQVKQQLIDLAKVMVQDITTLNGSKIYNLFEERANQIIDAAHDEYEGAREKKAAEEQRLAQAHAQTLANAAASQVVMNTAPVMYMAPAPIAQAQPYQMAPPQYPVITVQNPDGTTSTMPLLSYTDFRPVQSQPFAGQGYFQQQQQPVLHSMQYGSAMAPMPMQPYYYQPPVYYAPTMPQN